MKLLEKIGIVIYLHIEGARLVFSHFKTQRLHFVRNFLIPNPTELDNPSF